MARKVFVTDNNLVQDMIFHLRSKKTPSGKFRDLIKKITFLLAFEALKDITLKRVNVKTPNGKIRDEKINGKIPFVVSILRAAEAMAFGILELIPDAPVCHIGISRDEETLEPIEYLPLKSIKNPKDRICLVVDPMFATGGTASYTISLLKEKGVKQIKFLCIFASKKGINKLRKDHPDVEIYCAVVDQRLLKNGYIYPGCGDAGDRSFGTIS